MGRLILLTIALFLLVWLVRNALAGRKGRERSPGGPAPTALVRCAHCHTHLPQAEARAGEGDHHYCSDEHRRLGPRDE